MTPVPRGLLRILAGFAVLAMALAIPLAASGADPSPCAGDGVLVVPPGGDPFQGTDENDVILGTGGNDTIYGLGGDDTICAGEGDDTVVAGKGADTVYGEAGNDLIMGGSGDDTLLGGEGRDVIWGDAGTDSVDGGEDPDVLGGGDGPDTLLGGGGDDKIFGEAGRDRLFGGDGADELDGGAESDRIFGDAGNDFLWGDAWDDPAGSGDDFLVGGTGDDLLQGGPGADELLGQGGFDELWGGECSLKLDPDGAVDCRLVPSGRPEGDPTVDPGDTFVGGPGIDACNKVVRGSSFVLPDGCETYRGERPGSPRAITASQEWWGDIEQAFNERALLLLDAGKQGVADALLAEVTHAKQVAACESLGDIYEMTRFTRPDGSTGTWDGLFQHSSSYWAARATRAGYPGASVFDPLANARVTASMVAEDIEANWEKPNRLEDRLAWLDWSCDWWIDVKWGLWD